MCKISLHRVGKPIDQMKIRQERLAADFKMTKYLPIPAKEGGGGSRLLADFKELTTCLFQPNGVQWKSLKPPWLDPATDMGIGTTFVV